MNKCPICASNNVIELFTINGHRIFRCTDGRCSHEYCWPIPNAHELRDYYQNQIPELDETLDQKRNFRERQKFIAEIKRLAPRGRVLDIGCGFGLNLDLCKNILGFTTEGIEIDRRRAEIARRKGHDVFWGSFLDYPCIQDRFDLIILSHVIEHIADPLALLRQAHLLLNSHGILFIACPNHASLRAKIQGWQFSSYIPLEHLQFFNPKSMEHAIYPYYEFCSNGNDRYTHADHVKDMLAFGLRLKFLRKNEGHKVVSAIRNERFVGGRGALIKGILYSIIVTISKVLAPIVNYIGGDYLFLFVKKR